VTKRQTGAWSNNLGMLVYPDEDGFKH